MSSDKQTEPSAGKGEHHLDDEARRKFREALEKKRAHGGTDVSGGGGGSKVGHGRGGAGGPQMFRRKSGG